MRFRSLGLLALCLFTVIAFAACSGGSGDSRASVPNCVGGSFCLYSCNLGCSVTGTCAVTEIAQNQPIVLKFSQDVAKSSVDAGTLSIKTATGEAPVGRFAVEGSTITFVPEVRLSGGITTFGFRADESYILSLPGGGDTSQTVRSVAGDRLARTVTCTLSVTQGLIDLDGAPPAAELRVPTAKSGVPTDTSIVVGFSELIDTAPFQGGSTLTSPITYQLRKTLPDPTTPEGLRCDPDVKPILIDGVPQANVDPLTQTTDISLSPAIVLPSKVCVEVIVTDRVRDLSGKPAVPTTFRFFTAEGAPTPRRISETFANDKMLDRIASGGKWTGGRAGPALLGGSGLHGSFDPKVGAAAGTNTYVWSTDGMTIPSTHSLFGGAVMVPGGDFEFLDFIVPEGTKVIFRGSNPAIVRVRGLVSIQGEVNADGAFPNATYDARGFLDPITFKWKQNAGEVGAAGGAFGGRGGKGAKSSDGLGLGTPPTTDFDGAPGEDLNVPAGSGYATAPGLDKTGGGGGKVWPADALSGSVTFNLFNSVCAQLAGGGGGGAFLANGAPGTAIRTFGIAADLGPASQGGTLVPFVPLPSGVAVLDHFLVGGAGGGGGGSQPINMTNQQVNIEKQPWRGGAAGAGGGGAFAMRVGGAFLVANTGTIASRGAGGLSYTNTDKGPPSPGGAGSGGSIVLQLADGNAVGQAGTIDVRGGPQSVLKFQQFNGGIAESTGGAGSHGYVRMESPGPLSSATLGSVLGPSSVTADNFGPLTENDTNSGFQSLWYSTRQVFPPTFTHYRLTARIANGPQIVFSDDPASFNPANQPGLPFRFYIQGGTVNASTGLIEGEPGPWRDFVNGDSGRQSINKDGATGFRFMIIFDLSVEKEVVIEDLEVWFIA